VRGAGRLLAALLCRLMPTDCARGALPAALLPGIRATGCPYEDIGPQMGVVEVDDTEGEAGSVSGESALAGLLEATEAILLRRTPLWCVAGGYGGKVEAPWFVASAQQFGRMS